MALVNKDAAILVKDSEAKEKLINAAIDLVQDTAKQEQLKKNISSLALKNSAEKIAEEIYQLVN